MIVLHHLASSGGTIFTKAMVAQDNCVFLNEMHPHFTVIPEHGFSPSTPMHQYLARYNEEMTKEELVKAREELFRFQIQYLHELAGTRKLILREWSHGDFFEQIAIPPRPCRFWILPNPSASFRSAILSTFICPEKPITPGAG